MVIIGNGWVGSKLAAILGCPTISHNMVGRYDLSGQDWVINCAGKTGSPNVDACELARAETMDANAYFPLRAYEIATNAGARFAHVSSGCLFQGGPHDEDSPPNFFGSTYSISKIASDQVLKDKALVFRIRMPFGQQDHPKNLLTKLRAYASKGKLWNGLNSITEIDEACQVMANLIRGHAMNGAYNLVNEGAIETREIAEMLGLKANWWDEDGFAAATACKRSVCQLTNERAPMRPVREALVSCIAMKEAA